MTTASSTAQPRTSASLPVYAVIGAALWFAFALLIRLIGPSVFVPGTAALLITFLALMPVAALAVWLTARLGRVQGQSLINAVSIMSFTAMLLDGLAITWVPALYGLSAAPLALAAAWLLWGVGCCQLTAYLWRTPA
jgi:hypothetical protein